MHWELIVVGPLNALGINLHPWAHPMHWELIVMGPPLLIPNALGGPMTINSQCIGWAHRGKLIPNALDGPTTINSQCIGWAHDY
jgi:hypothetical protein